MKSPVTFFIALAVLLAAATVAAQVYRWVDKDGKVHYTDTPPPATAKGPGKTIDTRPALTTSSGADRAKSERTKSSDNDKRKDEAVDKGKKAEEDTKNAELNALRCKDAKSNIAALESGRPMSLTDETGANKFMTDAERAAQVKSIKEFAAESCK